MKKIEFRAKRTKHSNPSERWIYGSYVQYKDYQGNERIAIVAHNGNYNDIHKETVGQFTGLTDKCGKEIYEGDIIEDKNGIGVMIWFQTAWGIASYAYGYDGLKSYTAVDSFYINEAKEWSIIGNIYDNPELLGKEVQP